MANRFTNIFTKGLPCGIIDRDGVELCFGDQVAVYNWGRLSKDEFLGTGIIDFDNGCINTNPIIIESQYDFWNKAVLVKL